jgi:hypothetical protein
MVTLVSQVGMAVAEKNTGVPAGPAHSATMLLGQTICGGTEGSTVIVWAQLAILLQESVTSQLAVTLYVWPTGGFVTVLTREIVTFVPPQKSTADGTSKVQEAPHMIMRLVGQVTIGELVFITRIAWLHTDVLPQLSTA